MAFTQASLDFTDDEGLIGHGHYMGTHAAPFP
jgi:hypothetical protein